MDNKIRNVLIVDDEKDICSLLSAILNNMGLHVKTAFSLKEGSQTLKEKVDIAFLDIKLPDGEGFEIIEDLRELNDDVRIILISAFSGDDIYKKIDEYNVDYFIHKPFSKNDIKEVLIKSRIIDN